MWKRRVHDDEVKDRTRSRLNELSSREGKGGRENERHVGKET